MRLLIIVNPFRSHSLLRPGERVTGPRLSLGLALGVDLVVRHFEPVVGSSEADHTHFQIHPARPALQTEPVLRRRVATAIQ